VKENQGKREGRGSWQEKKDGTLCLERQKERHGNASEMREKNVI